MRPRAADARFFVEWIDRLWDLIELRNNFAKPEHRRQVKVMVDRARAVYREMAK